MSECDYGECCGCKHWSYDDWYCTAKNDVFLPYEGCNYCFEEGEPRGATRKEAV